MIARYLKKVPNSYLRFEENKVHFILLTSKGDPKWRYRVDELYPRVCDHRPWGRCCWCDWPPMGMDVIDLINYLRLEGKDTEKESSGEEKPIEEEDPKKEPMEEEDLKEEPIEEKDPEEGLSDGKEEPLDKQDPEEDPKDNPEDYLEEDPEEALKEDSTKEGATLTKEDNLEEEPEDLRDET